MSIENDKNRSESFGVPDYEFNFQDEEEKLLNLTLQPNLNFNKSAMPKIVEEKRRSCHDSLKDFTNEESSSELANESF